ncbi:1-acyl-sn-glycerol-3-phosphate acyltransferase [Priestia megaterium]|nr:1-acyl-sn-glycerol-3-phosphate acyltransferase [Priestia megaterium]
MSMIKTTQAYAYVIRKCMASIPQQRKIAKELGSKTQKKYAFQFAQSVSRELMNILNIPITADGVTNIPVDTPVLYVCNHQGNFDSLGLIATSPLPISFISKKEVKKIPIIRNWMALMGCLFIDRKKGKGSAIAIKERFQHVNKGEAFVIYPEGTRSKSDKMGSFKKGGLQIAYEVGIPIVPVTISGSYKIMEANKIALTSSPLTIIYHPVITPSIGNFEDYSAAIYSVIASSLPKT